MTTRRQFAAASAAALLGLKARAADIVCSDLPNYRVEDGIKFDPLTSIKRKWINLPVRDTIERPLLSSLKKQQARSLASAYTQLAAIRANDRLYRTGLLNQAKMHKYFCGEDGDAHEDEGMYNVHNTWAFLAWHRGFLYFHERILAKFAGKNFRLPVWDWEHSPRVPSPWEAPSPSALVTDCLPRGRRALTFPVDNCRLQAWLFSNTFAEFVGTSGGPGCAFSGVHSDVHIDLGGAMAVPATAAADPLFYAHHANVDRYWWHWSQQLGYPPDPGFYDQWFYYFDENGDQVAVCADQLMELDSLGYSYSAPTGVSLKGLEFVPPITDISSDDALRKLFKAAVKWLKDEDRKAFAQPALLLADAKAIVSRVAKLLHGKTFQIPVRLAATVGAQLHSGKYYAVGLQVGEGTPHTIGGFGIFSHGRIHSSNVTATGCFGSKELQLLFDAYKNRNPVKVVWGPSDRSGNVTAPEKIVAVTWNFLQRNDGLDKLFDQLL